MKPPLPDRGHLVRLDFTPQAGHEQAGRRPALVLTPAAYNGASGLLWAAPVTSRAKGYPFEVALPPGGSVHGVVLADHARSLDWRVRRLEFVEAAAPGVLDEVLAKLGALLAL